MIEGTIEREDTQLKNLKKANTQTEQQTQDQVEKRDASTAVDQRTIKDVTNKRSGRVKHRDDTDKMMNYDRRQCRGALENGDRLKMKQQERKVGKGAGMEADR